MRDDTKAFTVNAKDLKTETFSPREYADHKRIKELRHKIKEEGRQSLNPKEREEALILGITPKNISK